MFAAHFSLEDYLKRIGFTGDVRPDVPTLKQLMRRQLMSVPFENLDVQAGKIVSIIPEDIAAKIIPTRRGGYCYEVNSLFAMALNVIGIPYRILGARPMMRPVRWARTHMVLLASVEGREWLCDTGFGRFGLREPLDIAITDQTVTQDFDSYRLIRNEMNEYVLQAKEADGWVNQYSFDLSPFDLADFMPANYFNSAHPDSTFRQGLISVRHTETGRIVLRDGRLRIAENGTESVQPMTTEQADEALWAHFGLKRL